MDCFHSYPSTNLHEQFREQAAKTPSNIALINSEERAVTYEELDSASDRLAIQLMRLGVTKGDCVGVLMERCHEYVLAMLGALKAGAAYGVLDVSYPEKLMKEVVSTAAPRIVISKLMYAGRLPEEQTTVLLDSNWSSCLPGNLTDADFDLLADVSESNPELPAYVVFSSGTSGKPKGIAAPHRGALFSYEWRFKNIPYSANPFDIEGCNVFFVWEILRPLLKGQMAVIIPDSVIYDPTELCAFISKMKITRMQFTPSLLEAVFDNSSVTVDELSESLGSLSNILLCGEVVTAALLERAKRILPKCGIWNLYSISECHDVACVNLALTTYDGCKYTPVGRILPGVDALILDPGTLEKKPLGDEGELYVAGPCLAIGYINQPELTAERFPTINGHRMYKTGDRARLLPNGELEILGRCDSMQKIRGYSVELAAIEMAILALTDLVTSCAVVVQGEEGSDKFVVAYLVLRRDKNVTPRDVRQKLKSKLPHYMVPAYLIDLDELPTHSVSGKLDRKALPKVDVGSPHQIISNRRSRAISVEQDCTPPRDPIEKKIHDIWCEIMGLPQIDVVADNFFDLGGHSLMAAKLVKVIREKVGKQIGVLDVYSHSTIESMSSFLGGHELDSLKSEQSKVDLINEVKLFEVDFATNGIAMRAFWRAANTRNMRSRSVLITGATGFLGSFLLYELLSTKEVDIAYCIVRSSAEGPTTVQSRLRKALELRGLWEPEFESRIEVLSGDASLHHLGLQDDEYAFLCTEIDLVVHCAAMVNLVYPYEGLRAANVQGTRNIIELALTGKVKRLAYISTNGIFPDGLVNCAEDEDISTFGNSLSGGYSQSKWVAEQLVRNAAESGLPTYIFRPGNMSGDIGHRGGNMTWNESDFNYLVLTGSILLGVAPNLPRWLLEMTPVDVAAHAIVKIMLDKSALKQTFHVTNCVNSLEANDCFDALREMGYPLASATFSEWLSMVQESPNPALAKLSSALVLVDETQICNFSTFSNTRFVEKCSEFGISIPKISPEIIKKYTERWETSGVIPAPPVRKKGRLLGKLCIVTGASSGIGAAIAMALAEEGALLAIGSRRMEKLDSLAWLILMQHGTKVFTHMVDVTVREDVKDFVKASEAAFGCSCDIFVSNAGVMHYTLMEHCLEDQWEKEVDVNCKGLLHGIGAVLPGMIEKKSGHIIVTSSDAGRKVFPGLSVYSASKQFVEATCRGLREETAEKGLKVTTIQPGDCKSELSKCSTDEVAISEYSRQDMSREYWLDAKDVASAVIFAATAPKHVAINEVLVEPRGSPI